MTCPAVLSNPTKYRYQAPLIINYRADVAPIYLYIIYIILYHVDVDIIYVYLYLRTAPWPTVSEIQMLVSLLYCFIIYYNDGDEGII